MAEDKSKVYDVCFLSSLSENRRKGCRWERIPNRGIRDNNKSESYKSRQKEKYGSTRIKRIKQGGGDEGKNENK